MPHVKVFVEADEVLDEIGMSNVIQRVIWPGRRKVIDIVREATASGQRVKSTGRGVLVFYPAPAANHEQPSAA
jgi:hypothetical protein